MIYFFHHYEMPLILYQDRVSQVLADLHAPQVGLPNNCCLFFRVYPMFSLLRYLPHFERNLKIASNYGKYGLFLAKVGKYS